MNRRLVVEAANGDLKGRFVDIGRGFFQVFGTSKILLLIGFTIAGDNVGIAKAFRALLQKIAGTKEQPRRRAKRRGGTKFPGLPLGNDNSSHELEAHFVQWLSKAHCEQNLASIRNPSLP